MGITEGQVVHMAILLVTATLGADAWDWTLLTLPAAVVQGGGDHADGVHGVGGGVRVTVKAVSMGVGSVLTLWVALCSVYRVLFSGAAR